MAGFKTTDRKACALKMRYVTWEQAEIAREELVAKIKRKPRLTRYVILTCKFCRGFHIGETSIFKIWAHKKERIERDLSDREQA